MSTSQSYEDIEAIAIVGMSGRFPGAQNLEEYWQNLCNGVESIRWFTDEEVAASGRELELMHSPNLIKAAPIIDDVDLFDAGFFGYTPKEAEIMDPQQRLFLETAWSALEHAGYNSDTYDGWIGVYGGVAINGYLLTNLLPVQELLEPSIALQLTTANDRDYVATRVSYKLNLKGPSINVQSACSTSMVAVHLACQALLNYQCDMALAGGASIRVPQKAGFLHYEGGMYSRNARIRAFDAGANGTVFGDGVGAIVLKRMSEALADGDTIYAVVKGSAINNDGSDKIGFTAPSVSGQAAVVKMALGTADVTPESISYIETHGTGTPLGDPIEVTALTQVFREQTDRTQFCALGSAKTNIGHASAAAGVAGMIKTAMALRNRQIPPSLHFEQPNPKIDFENSPFFVNTELREWPSGPTPRRAGVSSFGVGGTNAHVILEEAPERDPSGPSRRWQMLTLSARSQPALDQAAANLAAHLRRSPDQNLADVAYTLHVGRKNFAQRRTLVVSDRDEAIALLEGGDAKRVLSRQAESDRAVVFMFSGQGAQYANMARDLYEQEAAFRAVVDQCCALLQPELGFDLRRVMFPPAGQEDSAAERLRETAITQPALFVIEYALAQLWIGLGVPPQAMIGHSIGEYVAATLAGVFSLEDALRLVAARGRLMQSLPGGAMLSVPMSEAQIKPLLSPAISIATINGPSRCVVAGPYEAIDALEQQLKARGVDGRRLQTSHAFHSPMMEPILEPFVAQFARVQMRAPQLPYISNVTGTWITDDQATDPHYWATHLRQAVRFADGLTTLMKDSKRVLLEVGPGQTLMTFARQHPAKTSAHLFLASVRHPNEQQQDDAVLLSTIGQLWLAGVAIDWRAFYGDERRYRIALPTYPFERQRFWIDPPRQDEQPKKGGASLRKKPDIADWFYLPSWKRSLPPVIPASANAERWLVFEDEQGLGARIAERLRADGHAVATVRAGTGFSAIGDDRYTIEPGQRDDYDALLGALSDAGGLPTRIAHLWNITADGYSANDRATLESTQDRSFYSLLWLAQALGQRGSNQPLYVAALSNNMQKVGSESILNPEKAALLGPIKVMEKEYPHVTSIAIDVQVPSNGALDQFVDQLVAELGTNTGDLVVAYRGYDRWVQDYETVRVDQAIDGRNRLRDGGVYLITGGLGGIGLVFAEHLAATAHAKLVLTGRSKFPDRESWNRWLAEHGDDDGTSQKIRKLQQIEAAGGDVLVLSADATDESQMRAVIERAEAEFGPLSGVIHAAGIAGGGIMQLKTREIAAGVLTPKIAAMRTLEAVLDGRRLDFMVLCSSTIGVIGGLGQVDYCAGNSFLDVFAPYYMARYGTYTVSINWDAWTDVGMAVNTALPPKLAELSQSLPYEPFDHPLLHERARDGSRTHFRTELDAARFWVLNEHKIAGTPALPGTSLLEMARAAMAQAYPGDTVEVRDVFFMSPALVPDGERRELHAVLEGDGELRQFRVQTRSGSATPQDHAFVNVARVDDEGAPRFEIEEIRARCTAFEHVVEPDELSKIEKLVYWGPRWNSLRRVNFGDGEAIGQLELPAEYADDLQSYVLHPALLDVATAFASGSVGEGSYLPFSYKRLRARGPLPNRLYSYARYRPNDSKETIAFDISILDEQGVEIIAIEEYTLKRVDAQQMGQRQSSESAADAMPDEALVGGDPIMGGRSAEKPVSAISEGMSPAEGVEVLMRVLSRNTLPQIVASTKDIHAAIRRARAGSTQVLAEVNAAQSSRTMHARPDVQTSYVEPRNAAEEQMAAIWRGALGIEQVGVHDNFFELGGDSVLAIQIVARINSLGYQITPALLFQHQTVGELVAALGGESATGATLSGDIRLTPEQQRRLELSSSPDRVAQAAVFDLLPEIDVPRFEQALEAVLRHHEALSLRITQDGGVWRQEPGDPATITVQHVDLTSMPPETREQAIDGAIRDAVSSLRLSSGTVLRASMITRGDDHRLLLVAHSSVIDGTSWQILLDDVQTVYQQLAHGSLIHLVPGASFTEWAQRIQALADSEALAAEREYWLALPYGVGLPDDEQADGSESATPVMTTLDGSTTAALLGDALLPYNTTVAELLLTAMAESGPALGGSRSLLIDVLSDGRISSDLDMARTVGCCGVTYPVFLDLNQASTTEVAIRAVKDHVRAVPNGGTGYALLRASDDDLRGQDQPSIRLAYHGGLGQAGMLLVEREPSQYAETARYAIDVAVRVIEGQLHATWSYDPTRYRRVTVARLADAWTTALQRLVEHCLGVEDAGLSAADFPEAGLSQDDLDKFLSSIGGQL